MSVRVTKQVWDESRHTGAELLMLLAIGDYAQHDGDGAYPSVPTLANKCRLSVRHAIRVLAALQAGGELQVNKNKGPRGTNRYRIVVGLKSASLEPASPLTPTSPPTPDAHVTPDAPVTLTPTSATPDTRVTQPLTPMSHEPLFNRQESSQERVRTRAKPKALETPIPQDFGISDAVRAWAASKCIENLDAHHEAFVDKCLAKGYTAVDWDAKFRTAVRDDWAGLRAPRDGGIHKRPSARTNFADTDYRKDIDSHGRLL